MTVPLTLTKCEILHKTVVYTMTACTVDATNKLIKVATGFTSDVAAGDSIAITLSLLTNPIT